MLEFSRWRAAAILCVAAILCLAAAVNVLPQQVFDALPQWARHKIELSYDLQGGSRIQLEVDRAAVHKEQVELLRDDVRRILRTERVSLLAAPVIRGDSVEVRLRETDYDRGMRVLSELWLPPQPVAPRLDRPRIEIPAGPGMTSMGADPNAPEPVARVVMSMDGHLIRLKLTQAAIEERLRQSADQSVDLVKRRLFQVGYDRFSISRPGADRILIEAPGALNLRRAFELLG